jgi:sigma-E factor negative regulatory protein RseC
MIEESGQVVDVEGGFAWIESERTSTCGGCSMHSGCGTGVIAKLLGQRRLRLRVVNSIDAGVGDHVVIGIPEPALVRGSLAVYAVPLAALFCGALAGNGIAMLWFPPLAEGGAIGGALCGLAAGFAWLRGFSRRTGNNPAWQPVILRRVYSRLAATGEGGPVLINHSTLEKF